MKEMGFGGRNNILILCFVLVLAVITSTATLFNCSSDGTCNSMVGYVSPNITTLDGIKILFGVKNLRSILAANNLRLSTPPNTTVFASQTVKIPFNCLCTNGTGISNGWPIYTVVPDDGLYHIAAEVFAGLVTYQQIQVVNNIDNANLIKVGQKLRIPLPCSCDEVDGEKVVHYGHVVAAGSTVDGIAQQYNTTQDTLLKLNGLASPNDLIAGVALDVPLRTCTSMVSNDSLDYPFLVATDTYTFTAKDCVVCKCDAANNWTLQCEPSQINSSMSSCPSMQCQGPDNLYLGNTTSSTCNRTFCAYAGYKNQTILTTLAVESTSTCPAPDNNSPKASLQGWRWNIVLIATHLVVLGLHLFH